MRATLPQFASMGNILHWLVNSFSLVFLQYNVSVAVVLHLLEALSPQHARMHLNDKCIILVGEVLEAMF